MSDRTIKGHLKGTHRTIAPSETLKRVRPLLKQMGITRIANITGLDTIGIAVAAAIRPNAKAISVAQGKGLTLDCAKASAMMEAVETYHAEHVELPLILSSYRQLSHKQPVVDVTKLPKSSLGRYHDDLSLLWLNACQLGGDEQIMVPFESVHCNFELPLPSGHGAFLMGTNGLASGNTTEEAISHGLCELIERDAKTLWSIARTTDYRNQRLLDLSTIDCADCQGLLAQFTKAEVNVAVWDITSDIGIPTFYCGIVNKTFDPAQCAPPATGFGTHPCKSIALIRALSEAAQSRLTLIAGSRDDISNVDYLQNQNPDDLKRLNAYIDTTPATWCFEQINDWQHDTIDEDLALLKEKLQACGMRQILWVDLHKPEFAIPVVKVIVPGLEAMHSIPGYVPGQRATKLMEAMS